MNIHICDNTKLYLKSFDLDQLPLLLSVMTVLSFIIIISNTLPAVYV